ncbi:protein DpdH [Flavobacterium sp.]|uniref:protein DpdH n=1 Tax=Flavobacterium sp. TaxID=239 RepID=UPI002629804D|nr:protein DpdH [Flavobacterium sp.]
MSLKNYWPSKEHVAQCIRTEAEELAEITLLAVHEPMQLLKKEKTQDVYVTENELLEHFLKVDRPIPIIGRSGVGKSHLIRWLATQLKFREESKDWHVVRIPKNASLRQVLDLLLNGLTGEVFEQARSKINSIGQSLDTMEVADHLLVFMSHQLKKKYKDALRSVEDFKLTGTVPSDEEKKRLKKIMTHASDEVGLPALINDVIFKVNLLKPSHCIYQFASRLTQGASNDELSKNDYQIHADDLDFSMNLQDLALSARRYVQTAQLNTSQTAREDAVSVLNEVLGDATREAFHHLFQFNGGSFQELFKDIRRHLKGRTLVILVEDMAAISAIEDVLIDSLLEQQITDGEATLCPLRSAIAVTDGYAGYVRRQDTIKTRSRSEWWIEERVGNEEETTERIIDFCSRYLNAARHGYDSLNNLSLPKVGESWPPVWQDVVDEDHQYLPAFQTSIATGVPLYPFNKAAITALSDKFCRDPLTGDLQFNPREILNNILLAVLRDCRDSFEESLFPPVSLAGIRPSGGLRTGLHTLGLVDSSRTETLAAIWGFGSKNLEELKKKLSADIALSFNMPDFSRYLNTGLIEGDPQNSIEVVKAPEAIEIMKILPATDPNIVAMDKLIETVDHWFEKRSELGQNEARLLRTKLDEMYQIYARNDWKNIRDLPSLKVSNRPNIYLPNAMGNPATQDICFCNDQQFSDADNSRELHAVALAIFRYDFYNPRDEGPGWTYPEGFDDFTRYQNFATKWVPLVLQSKVVEFRSQLTLKVAKHIQSAWVLGVIKETDTHIDCLNKLLIKSDAIKSILPSALSNTVRLVREEHLAQWDELRKGWLSLISASDQGLLGDLAIIAIREGLKSSPDRSLLRNKELVSNEIQETLSLFNLLTECKSAEEFKNHIDMLLNLVRNLQKTGNYPINIDLPTAKTFLGKIEKLLSMPLLWTNVKNLMSLFKTDNVIRDWWLINQIDENVISELSTVLVGWKTIYSIALPRLRNANRASGGDQLVESKALIDELLTNISTVISEIGVKND